MNTWWRIRPLGGIERLFYLRSLAVPMHFVSSPKLKARLIPRGLSRRPIPRPSGPALTRHRHSSAHSDNYLVVVKFGVIVDVLAQRPSI
jgi:hypothetical protein